VWAWLVRAQAWPVWYRNSRTVAIEGGGQELAAGCRFTWRTFGVGLDSRVEEYEPPKRLAWTARGVGVWAYHAWLISPTADGCRVLTEETQHGWLARLGNVLMPRRMYRGHELWLSALAERAQSGPPRQ
jgi:hypothetical protein